MRGAFINTLTKLAKEDTRIFLLTGDLGYTAIEPFMEAFPNRFFNVGVAEQNMLGIATGLAEAGFIPFVYSIATFVSMRPYEFIRNGPVLHDLPVRIVGVGGGFDYGLNGITHFAVEDIGIMRAQPNLTIIAPADFEQTQNALRQSWDIEGPIYYRIGKDDQNVLPGLNGHFDFSQISIIKTGQNILLITYGSIAFEVVQAAETLARDGIDCGIAVVSTLNPVPVQSLSDLLKKYNQVITIESHYNVGGLGSLVAEVIAEHGINAKLCRRGIGRMPSGISGTQAYMNEKFGISANAIVETVKNGLGG